MTVIRLGSTYNGWNLFEGPLNSKETHHRHKPPLLLDSQKKHVIFIHSLKLSCMEPEENGISKEKYSLPTSSNQQFLGANCQFQEG